MAGTGSGQRVPDFDAWAADRGPWLVRLAYVLTGDDARAHDLAQETLVRLWMRWSRLAELESPDAYARTVLTNLHRTQWRRLHSREVLREQPLDAPHTAATDRVEMRDSLWDACLRLTSTQRIAIVLRYFEDLGFDEIAAITGVRESTVRSRVARGLERLRKEWVA